VTTVSSQNCYAVSNCSLHRRGTQEVGDLNQEDIEKEAMAARCFFHPNMPFRTSWDICQVALLIYLLLMVPLRVGFELEVCAGSRQPTPTDTALLRMKARLTWLASRRSRRVAPRFGGTSRSTSTSSATSLSTSERPFITSRASS
jgi:hypothetical protein